MSSSRQILVSAEPAAVAFVQQCLGVTGAPSPVAALIYGRFTDEAADGFRVLAYDSLEAARQDFSTASIVQVDGMAPLLVEPHLVPHVDGRRMFLVGLDVLEFRDEAAQNGT